MKNGTTLNVVLGGRGGQGILFASTVLEQAALARGLDVLGSETHGMAQRGGSVVSHLKVGPALGPLVAEGEADLVISLEKTETYRIVRYLKAEGACFANVPDASPLDGAVAGALETAAVRLFCIDADALARSLGSPQAVNAAMLGLLAAWPSSPFPRPELEAALHRTGSERFRAKNLEVFEAARLRGAEKYGFPR